jgi:hypothetical protein
MCACVVCVSYVCVEDENIEKAEEATAEVRSGECIWMMNDEDE